MEDFGGSIPLPCCNTIQSKQPNRKHLVQSLDDFFKIFSKIHFSLDHHTYSFHPPHTILKTYTKNDNDLPHIYFRKPSYNTFPQFLDVFFPFIVSLYTCPPPKKKKKKVHQNDNELHPYIFHEQSYNTFLQISGCVFPFHCFPHTTPLYTNRHNQYPCRRK